MKALALAATVAAGVLCSAGTADAQYRARGSYRYVAPTYVTPAYTYVAPSYYSGYVDPYVDSSVVTSGYTTPYVSGYSPMVYPSGYSYPSTWNAPYSGSYYNSPSYYGSGYSGSGLYISPRGVGWRR